MISDEEGRKLNFRTEINHQNGVTVHGMICNKNYLPYGVQLMSYPDGTKSEFLTDPKDANQVIFKIRVDKAGVDAMYEEKARKQINRAAMYSRMFLTFYSACVRALMKSES